VTAVDFICHLAGVNRSTDPNEFRRVNVDVTRLVCEQVARSGRSVPIIFASSSQAGLNTPYGTTKLAAENLLLEHSRVTETPVYIFRLPNVFGKWCRPNYNSVVATYCYNIARDLPIRIDDPEAVVRLAYIDDVVNTLAQIMTGTTESGPYCSVEPVYTTTVGELANQIRTFRSSRESLVSDRVGVGLVRALYATYVSYLPTEAVAYELTKHDDARGR
jgi:UDP-2-acetamido-2,6-beta-L-arabino-hexul-4-ose reductase